MLPCVSSLRELRVDDKAITWERKHSVHPGKMVSGNLCWAGSTGTKFLTMSIGQV